MQEQVIISTTPEQTRAVAAELVNALPSDSHAIIALHGNLGAGKTCFVQGMATALNINCPVTSPTFTIINEYKGTRRLNHIDLYRLNSPDEVLAIDFEDYLDSLSVTAIEWPDRAVELLPVDTIHVYIKARAAQQERDIRIVIP